MKHYTRITEQERYLIEKGIREGRSRRAIGKIIDRPTKTVCEEIKRNGGYLGYYAAKAHHERFKSNRDGCSKIDANKFLTQYIREKLKERWSPEVIAGRWNKESIDCKITHESIYTWIYKQSDDLYLSLPRKKKKRGLRPRKSKSKIPNRTSIHTRPVTINDRSEVGHYESDLVFQQGNQSQNILTVVERKSRMIILRKNQSKRTEVVIEALKTIQLKSEYAINSITFDNGSEFVNHSDLGVDTYFCDPGSPWQKGAIENANGILRRHLDYRTDANDIDQQMLDSIANAINNKPRKILGFLTPNEVIKNLYREKLESVTFQT
jgi:transposase, IS30 family